MKSVMNYEEWCEHKLFIHANPIWIVVLGCDAVGGYQWITSIFTSTQKVEAVGSSEMLVTTYRTTQHHNPDDPI
jgi:hypothetical protein